MEVEDMKKGRKFNITEIDRSVLAMEIVNGKINYKGRNKRYHAISNIQ